MVAGMIPWMVQESDVACSTTFVCKRLSADRTLTFEHVLDHVVSRSVAEERLGAHR